VKGSAGGVPAGMSSAPRRIADPDGPDEPLADAPRLWPDTTTFPFHYRHPVTGRPVQPGR
jgi:hypothetical protein